MALVFLSQRGIEYLGVRGGILYHHHSLHYISCNASHQLLFGRSMQLRDLCVDCSDAPFLLSGSILFVEAPQIAAPFE